MTQYFITYNSFHDFAYNTSKTNWPVISNFRDIDMNEVVGPYSAAKTTDDSCRLKFIEIVPLTRDTDGPYTTEFDSGDWSAEVKQEILPVVKQEPDGDDVCSIVLLIFCDLRDGGKTLKLY